MVVSHMYWCAGITLSAKQVERGTQLAKERGLNNVKFMVSIGEGAGSMCGEVSAGRPLFGALHT